MSKTDEGWVSIYRRIRRHWIWNAEKFDRAHAWIDLLLRANHADRKVVWRGELIEVKRGQLISSITKLAQQWKWGRKRVRNFLELLEKEGMIRYSKGDSRKLTLTISNYEHYQKQDAPEGTANRSPEGTPEGAPEGAPDCPQTIINKNNLNNLNNEGRQPDSPESLCPPRKSGKGEQSKAVEDETAYIKRVNAFFSDLDPEFQKQLKAAYPGIDLNHELQRMKVWLISNTNRRKKNLNRFIANWLNHSEERRDAKSDARQTRPSNGSTAERRAKLDALAENY